MSYHFNNEMDINNMINNALTHYFISIYPFKTYRVIRYKVPTTYRYFSLNKEVSDKICGNINKFC